MKIVRLYHITSPENALSILDSGKFHPVSTHPLNNDNGLNCFSFKPGYRLGQCFTDTGAKVVMEWSGKVFTTHPDESPPLPVDILHDQFPWRCFIRGGSNSAYLRIVAVRFDKGKIDNLIYVPQWYKALPKPLRVVLYRRKKLLKLRSIRQKYQHGRQHLEVLG
ncbi:hypothetical protein [uncultured Herbaspirillum sp.]|uniref:hypothetical protein n=1 Tax=uncultured Herbaspirillum sp. TaxID=160236 RepID=UPI0025851683|nr:hypothetical protein [uncultured Herbaspirillum sp.]